MDDLTRGPLPRTAPDIVFWLNSLSIHQAPIIRALSSEMSKSVLVVADEGIPADRRAQGWSSPDHGDAMVWKSPTPAERRELIARCNGGTAHVFSGLGTSRAISDCMIDVARSPRRHIAVMTEPWNPAGIRGLARSCSYRWRHRRFGAAVDSLLAIGPLARSQFVAAGFNASRVHPYAYFVESGRHEREAELRKSNRLEIGFVGQFIPRKDVSLLLAACAGLHDLNWHLHLAGSGPLRAGLEIESRERGLQGRVSFRDAVENGDIPALLSTLDLLVLPSVFDGWGAVVNEALTAGTRVCVSDSSGSSDLVRGPAQGSVFTSRSVDSLSSHIRSAIERGAPSEAERTALSQWSDSAIGPGAGARYLWDILSSSPDNGSASVPPWRSTS